MVQVHSKRLQAALAEARDAARLGRWQLAVEHYRSVQNLVSGRVDIQVEYGIALARAQARTEAEALFRSILERAPGQAPAWRNLGLLLRDQGRLEEAEACHRQAVSLAPGDARGHNALGVTLQARGNLREAKAAFEAALAAAPGDALALTNLSSLLVWQFDPQPETGAILGRAMDLLPGSALVKHNLVRHLQVHGRFEEALATARAAVLEHPGFSELTLDLAGLLLLLGHWKEGWIEYGKRPIRRQWGTWPLTAPVWQGEPLAGRRLFVYNDQGLGDFLQVSRYLPALAELGGKVLVGCQPAIRDLLAAVPGGHEVVAEGAPLPAHDLVLPSMDLPGRFQARPDALPPCAGLVRPDPEVRQAWSPRLGDAPGLKVGLCWRGNPGYALDRHRSMPLETLAPLLQVPGARFVSLQKGPGEDELASQDLPLACPLQGAGPHTFQDLAALMDGLDLVVSVDTGVAHLAGCLSIPTLVMLPFVPDWRWGLARADCPWYPSLRLYRQHEPGRWSGVVAEVAREVARRVALRG